MPGAARVRVEVVVNHVSPSEVEVHVLSLCAVAGCAWEGRAGVLNVGARTHANDKDVGRLQHT